MGNVWSMIEKLPKKIRQELEPVLRDPVKFIQLLKIQDKHSGKLIPFAPNNEQVALGS